jgi:hypothetical protein
MDSAKELKMKIYEKSVWCIRAIVVSTLIAFYGSAYSSDVAIMPTNIVGNSSGTEFIIDFEADYGGGVIDTGTVYIQGNMFSIIGTETLPTVHNQIAVSYNAAPPPCTPDPFTGTCEFGIHDFIDFNPFDDGFQTHAKLPPFESTQYLQILIPIAACAVGMVVNHGLQMHACQESAGIHQASHGMCGMFGGSHVECNEPDPTPPEEPDLPDGPELPVEPPPTLPPNCSTFDCDDFWDWNRDSMSFCLHHNPAACF